MPTICQPLKKISINDMIITTGSTTMVLLEKKRPHNIRLVFLYELFSIFFHIPHTMVFRISANNVDNRSFFKK
jgi:hypothetical protein